MVNILRLFAVICTAFILGKLISKIKLPAILGWLITGVVFGPYLAGIVTFEITNLMWYISPSRKQQTKRAGIPPAQYIKPYQDK